MLNIVSSYQTLQEFKKSQYFRVSLGLVATVDKKGSRSFNTDDKFSYYYNTQYKTTIYGQGNIGDVKFYVDHYIKDDTFAVYTNDFQEFLFTLDRRVITDKGVDFYIGYIFKSTEEQYDELVKNNELKKQEVKPAGEKDKIFSNPGNVRYEDLKAYLDEQRKNRLI